MRDGLPKLGDLILGKYLLESVLGEGGMGIVFAARHEVLGQRVAVKLVQPDFAKHPEAVARFVNEARASALIENDHVARVLDVGTLDTKLPYMVLEYLDGEDLEHLSDRCGLLPVSNVIDYLLQAIEGVAYAHARGIVHRDLKPSNLFLAKRQDGTARVKVLDFGISKITSADDRESSSMTRTNSMLGSPLYMSPEQLRDSKTVDHRCDIWAFGIIAFELLTGRPPFLGENAVALFASIQESDPPDMQALRTGMPLPVGLEPVILGCLKRRADDRYTSVAELALALAPYGTEIGSRCAASAARVLGSPPQPAHPGSAPDVAARSSSPGFDATVS
ncbi:MAG: serine/threonine-protein kinase, partial [Polyangiaceae bacterium]